MNDFKNIIDNLDNIEIDIKNLDKLVKIVKKDKYYHISKYINNKRKEEEKILIYLLYESMNYGFYMDNIWYKGNNEYNFTNNNALLYAIWEYMNNNSKLFDIVNLSDLQIDEFKKIFIGYDINLIDERYNSFKEVVNYIYSHDNFYQELYNKSSYKELEDYLLECFPSFRDMRIYKGKVIYFNGSCRNLINDLCYISKIIKENIKTNNSYGYNNYSIYKLFKYFNIIKINKDIDNNINKNIIIDEGSNIEIELRICMIYLIELLKVKLNLKNINYNSMDIIEILTRYSNSNIRKIKSYISDTINY